MSSETPPGEDSLSAAFRRFGENLIGTIQAAWDTPERKSVQEEIENGLNNLADSVKSGVNSFNDSPAGQRLKSDFDDLRGRVQSGEVESQLREELLKALSVANSELEKAASRLRKTEKSDSPPPPSAGKEE